MITAGGATRSTTTESTAPESTAPGSTAGNTATGTAGFDAGDRQLAARAMLMTPILVASEDRPTFDLVRRHATALTAMFATQLGYPLIIGSSFARLVKSPPMSPSPARGLRRSNERAFGPAEYVHLSLACAALLAPGVGDQVLLSALVEQIRADAAAGSIDISDHIVDRRRLVSALRQLVDWGVISETEGTVTLWGERPDEEALLSIDRGVLLHLLPRPLHGHGHGDSLLAVVDDQPRRRLRRRLVENPTLLRSDLPADELDVLSRERTELTRALEDNFGLVLEVRAEGVLAYDPGGGLTDIEFPGSGSAKQAALLLLDTLTARITKRDDDGGLIAAWDAVDEILAALLQQHGSAWRSVYRESTAQLRDDVVDLLVALALAVTTPDALIVLPFAARYQPTVVTSSGPGPGGKDPS